MNPGHKVVHTVIDQNPFETVQFFIWLTFSLICPHSSQVFMNESSGILHMVSNLVFLCTKRAAQIIYICITFTHHSFKSSKIYVAPTHRTPLPKIIELIQSNITVCCSLHTLNIWSLPFSCKAHSYKIAQHFFFIQKSILTLLFITINMNVGFISLRQFDWFCFIFIVHPNRSIFPQMEIFLPL